MHLSLTHGRNTKLYLDNSRLWPLVPPLLELCHCTCDKYKIDSLTAVVPVLKEQADPLRSIAF